MFYSLKKGDPSYEIIQDYRTGTVLGRL
jgi:hypothetical protein